MILTHVPTLLIGLGGTGITVLRFLHALANQGIDPDLARSFECGSLTTLGIDADPEANSPTMDIDPAIFGICETGPSPTASLITPRSLLTH
jgi:hypothetical protein